jgi:hypothetical protein
MHHGKRGRPAFCYHRFFPHLLLIEWNGFNHIIKNKLGIQQTAIDAQKASLDSTQSLVIIDSTESVRKIPWGECLRREQHGNVTVWWI